MAIVPNYMNQVNAQNLTEGLGSIVQALNNPQAFANAELLRAHKDYYGAQSQKTLADILNDKQESTARVTTLGAQANQYNTGADVNRAQANQYAIETKAIIRQQGAQDSLAPSLVATGVPQADANFLQQAVIASPTSTSKNIVDSANTWLQRDPVTVPQGGSVLLPPTSPLLPQNQPNAAQPAPQATATSLGEAISGLQSGPVFRGNMVTSPGMPSRQLTPGEKSVDESVGKEVADTLTQGKLQDAQKQIQNLEFAIGNLKTKQGISGLVVGNIPDGANRAMGNNVAVDTRQSIEDSVQRGLRAVLGAQFTEKEGERLIARAYDPSATQDENMRRVNLLLNSMKKAYSAKSEAISYFNKNGTMKGFEGQMPSMSSIETDSDPNAVQERVQVVSPDGTMGTISKTNLESALSQGYKLK
jgi:hypothetical protein